MPGGKWEFEPIAAILSEMRDREIVSRSEPVWSLRDVSAAYGSLGKAARGFGDLSAAQSYYSDGLEIDRSLARRQPDSVQAQRDLAVSFFKMMSICEELKEEQDADGFAGELYDQLVHIRNSGMFMDQALLNLLKSMQGGAG